jgi:rhomboid protease GluP
MEPKEIVQADQEQDLPRIYKKMRGNLLTKKPVPHAWLIALLAVGAVVFGSFFFWGDFLGAEEWMPVSANSIFQRHEYWRLWTALFAHAQIGHLLSNCILFVAFGYFLAGHFSWRVFPGVAFLFGGLTNLIAISTMPPKMQMIGVSAVVYWMGAAWLTLNYLIEKRGKKIQRVLRCIGVAVVLFVPETFDPQVSYVSHFSGFVLGMLWAIGYYNWNRKKIRAADRYQTVVEEPFPFDSL